MKSIQRIALTLLIMLGFSSWWLPAAVSAYDLPAHVGVGLKYGSTAVQSCTVNSSSGFWLGRVTSIGLQPDSSFPQTQLTVSVDNGVISLMDDAGTVVMPDIGETNCLMPYDFMTTRLALDGREYRGGLQFKPATNGVLTVINVLPAEHYLYGVIHREMGQSRPLEALKAQAVAARSYMAGNPGRHKANGFDYCATTHCQVYGGFNDEYDSTRRAVDQTAGQVLLYNNVPVSANYHSNSGGHTLNSEDVWSGVVPYLRGKPDPWTPVYSWTASFTFEELQEKLAAAGFNIGTVKTVQITGRNSAGAVSRLTIVGENGQADLLKDRIRTVLGATKVRSTMFNIGNSYTGTNPAPKPAPAPAPTMPGTIHMLGASGGSRPLTEQLTVMGADGRAILKTPAELFINNGSRTLALASFYAPADSTQSPAAPPITGGDSTIATAGSVSLSGRGYGHGVGMSQMGAIEMARKGKNYQEILKFYYTGVEVR